MQVMEPGAKIDWFVLVVGIEFDVKKKKNLKRECG